MAFHPAAEVRFRRVVPRGNKLLGRPVFQERLNFRLVGVELALPDPTGSAQHLPCLLAQGN